jgi:hypothetical protein
VSSCKEIEWRITLIGDYEKASKHRLCKNEQRAKKGRFWRTGCRLVARDGVRWMNGAFAADFAWHGPTTGSCRRPRVERLSTATTIVALSARRSRITARSAISFIVEDEVTIVGMFSQNGFQTIKTRRHRFRQRPGVYETAAELIAALLLAYWMPSHPR